MPDPPSHTPAAAPDTKLTLAQILPSDTTAVPAKVERHEDSEKEGGAPPLLTGPPSRNSFTPAPTLPTVKAQVVSRVPTTARLLAIIKPVLIGPLYALGSILLGAIVLVALAALGAAVMCFGSATLKNSRDPIDFDRHVALIGTVGASVSAVASIAIAAPIALIVLGRKKFWGVPVTLFILLLMWIGPIGAVILHRFGLELQIGIVRAIELSVVGFFCTSITLSVVIFGVYTLAKDD